MKDDAHPEERVKLSPGAWYQTMPLVVCLFVLLFALYMLMYSGTFHSVDEISRFAVMENLVKNGRYDANSFLAIHFGLWQDIPPENGTLYSRYGLADSVLPIFLYWPALQFDGVGLVQATMLFNALVTPLTAGFLLLFVVRLGYPRPVGFLTGLAFGVATIAAVYAKYLFSEPLAALTMLAAAYFLLCYRDALPAERPRRRWACAALAGAAFGLALLNRLSNIIVAPAILGYPVAVLVAYEWQAARDRWPGRGRFPSATLPSTALGTGKASLAGLVRRHWTDALAFLVPLLACCAVIVAYNVARFGDPLRSGYVGLEDRFLFPSLTAAYGMLFSPGKGFFVYSPILLAALVAVPAFFRPPYGHRAEASLALAVIVLHVVFYSAYDTWTGRACWGPRHIVPMTPFVALFLAPAITWAWHSWLRAAALALLGAASVGVQLIGASVDFFPYLSWLGTLGPKAESTLGIYDPRYSPIVGNLSQVSLTTLDYAWAYAGGLAGHVDALPILAALALALAAGLGAWLVARRRLRPGAVALSVAGAVLAIVGLVAVSLPRYYEDPRFGPRADERAAIAYLEEQARPGDALICTLTSDLGIFWNRNRARIPWYSLYREVPPDWADKVEAVLQGAVSRERRLWLLLDNTPPGDPNSGVERWLAEHTYPMGQERLGDLRLCLYTCPATIASSLAPAQAVDARLGESITLVGYTLADGPFRPGSDVQVSLYWRAESSSAADYTVFVQLLGPAGVPVAQRDSYPVAAFRPTSSWAVGETIRDNHGLSVPVDTPPGRYRLIVGMYDLATQSSLGWAMARLPVTPSGGDFVLLAEFDLEL